MKATSTSEKTNQAKKPIKKSAQISVGEVHVEYDPRIDIDPLIRALWEGFIEYSMSGKEKDK